MGTFPAARYFSFVSYTATGQIFESISDFEIAPVVAGTNPFATRGAAAGAPYSLKLVEANGTQAAAAAAAGETVLLVPKSAGSVIYRIYGANPGTNATGGQPLPSFVSTTTALPPSFSANSSSSSPVPVVSKTTPPCAPNKAGNALASGLLNAAAALVSTRVPPFLPRPQPLFARTNSSAANLFFGNPDSAYLSVLTKYAPGTVAVFRGTMFEYPDTQIGQLVPPPPARDLRFSSLCTYKYQSPFPLVACAADFEMPLDSQGRFTVVSGLPQDKPSDAALSASSAVWVPALEEADAASTPGLALFRTMLPSIGFSRAAQNVPADGSPASAEMVMQTNYPKGVYCQANVFVAGGFDACVAAAV